MNKQPLTLKDRQMEYLRILKELDRFCAENVLRYYIGCGTLIGAVRHKGFIPWDDDLDVFMPRPDYMRMVNEYQSSEFSFHSIYNDKSHPYNFGRLCCGRVYSSFRNKEINNFGIDVYVINGAPSSNAEQLQLMNDAFFHIRRKNKLKKMRNLLIKKHLWPFSTLDFSLMNRELFKAEKVFQRYDYDTSEYIWPYGGGRLIMKKENYGSPVRVRFEDGMFNAPEHYDEVLRLGYGDYMKLPPENQRKSYHGGKYYWK